MAVSIVDATCEHLEGWMALVRLVRDNFPGLETEELMQEYQRTVQKFILRGEAVCALEDGKVVGALLYSKTKRLLCFLAVHPDFRRRGAARGMVQHMLERMPAGEVRVQTFRQGDPRGKAARPFYSSMGFVPDQLSKHMGYPEQDFVLKR